MKVRRLLYGGLLSMSIIMTGCYNHSNNIAAVPTGEITIVSRETGSGTRDAFVSQANLLYQADQQKIDQTTLEAIIQNSTAGVLSTVQGDNRAIGYVSLGTMTDIVKPLAIDGVMPTRETILSGEYLLQRPFIITWPKEVREVVKDFINFINSQEGQDVIIKAGYVPANKKAQQYEKKAQSGLVTIVGSTSVTPVMEQLAQQYKKQQPNVQIDIISNGSTAGMTAIEEQTADIGMSSRQLKAEEKSMMDYQAFAMDGIVVVVNKNNSINQLTLQQVTNIFNGTMTEWQQVNNK